MDAAEGRKWSLGTEMERELGAWSEDGRCRWGERRDRGGVAAAVVPVEWIKPAMS